MTSGVIKIIGIVATGIGFLASLVGDWVKDKKLDEKIAKEVSKQMSNND